MSRKIHFSFASLVIISLVLLSFPVSSSAQGSTPTVSPTWDFSTPPFTPTPGGDPFVIGDPINFDCPADGGLPSGWGTTVPDDGWLAACGHCGPTPTAYPTYAGDTSAYPLQCDGPGCH